MSTVYVQPNNYVPCPEGPPPMHYEGQNYNSGDAIDISPEERSRLSEWFLFSDGEAAAPAAPPVVPEPQETAPETTGDAGNVSGGEKPPTDKTS